MKDRIFLFRLFVLALTVRWGLALILYLLMGNDAFFGTDSRGFFGWISEHVEHLQQGRVSGWQWLGPNLSLLPVPSLLWTLNGVLFGEYAALSSILCQGALDSYTCVLVCLAARELDARLALPAGVASACNPTQVVMANLYYTDAIFLFFFAVVLLGAVRWLKQPDWRAASLIGAGMGGAMLCRVVIAPWAGCLIVYLVAAPALQRQLRREHLVQLAFAVVVAALCTAPVVGRNRTETGKWTLTTQTGAHTAFWVVPLVMQAKNGTPWERGAEEMKRRLAERHGPPSLDQGIESQRQAALAGEVLRKLGAVAIAKAWLYGAAINLGTPVAAIFPPLAQLPRTGFFATPGGSMPEKIANFLFRSDNALFAWSVLAGLVGVAAIRLVQLRGTIALLARRELLPGMLLLLSWVAFILLVSGPVASPKYRLPIEPVLAILAAAGYLALVERTASRRFAHGS